MKPLGSIALLAAVGCHSGDRPMPVVTDGGVFTPGHYNDPLVQLERLAGSTFVEIQEVRARNDGRVFFCSGVRGLNVVDASTPDHMNTVAQLRSSLGSSQYPRCQHLAWDGNVVLMTSRGDEIQPTPFVTAFDLSSGTPVELGSFQQAGRTFEGIAAQNGLVYLAMHKDGLAVLSRSGNQLTQVGVATGLTNAWGVAVAGSLVYVADGVGGLAVVDVSSPSAPKKLGEVATSGDAQSVAVDGTTAFVAAGSAGLVAVDVSHPSAPTVLSKTPVPGSALQVSLAGGRAWVADWMDTRVYDVSSPARPRLVATERIKTDEPFSRVLGVGASGDVGFLGEWTGLYSYRFVAGVQAPDILVSSHHLDFGSPGAGATNAKSIMVTNQGTARLVAWQIAAAGSGFSVDMPNLVLDPGAQAMLHTSFAPADTNQQNGTLTLKSDDPDWPTETISLIGNQPGVATGQPAPEVVVALLGGSEWRLSQQAGHIRVLAYFATF